MINPPVADKELKITKIHDIELEDNYFWLRDKENPRVITYLEAENEYTSKMMGHTEEFQKELYNELKGRINETDESAPIKYGDYYYYYRTVEGKQYQIQCRKYKELNTEEQILIDGNEMAEGHDYFKLIHHEVSPDHKLVAFTTDTTGYEHYTLRIKNINTGEFLPDQINKISGSFTWGDDNTIYYMLRDDIHRPYMVKKHVLGSDSDQNEIIFEEPDNTRFVGLEKSNDKKYLFIQSASITSSEALYLSLKEKDAKLQVFSAKKPDVEYSIDHHEGYFYVITNEDALNFKLIRTPVSDIGKSNWEEIRAHDSKIKLDWIDPFKNFLTLHKRVGGLRIMEVIDAADLSKSHDIEMNEPIYTYSSYRQNFEYDSPTYRFIYNSLVTPDTTYDYNIDARSLEMKKQREIKNYNPSEFVTKREFATAADGTKIPISLVHKKGISKNSNCLLYGYGSYGYTMDPSFNSHILSLLQRDFVYVIAHVRGSQYNGRQWYEDGKFLKKKNTFTDFVSVAEFLVENDYSSPSKLFVRGGSAGGLLMGAVVNLRPDLFRAVIAQVPFVDVINTMLDDSIPLTTNEYAEWGNPNEKKFFDYMLSYSPYDNIEKKDYPDILITAGLNDPRVHYWEPAKFTAKLREYKTDSNTVLLKTQMGSGHGGPSGRYSIWKEVAFIYSFILDKTDKKE